MLPRVTRRPALAPATCHVVPYHGSSSGGGVRVPPAGGWAWLPDASQSMGCRVAPPAWLAGGVSGGSCRATSWPPAGPPLAAPSPASGAAAAGAGAGGAGAGGAGSAVGAALGAASTPPAAAAGAGAAWRIIMSASPATPASSSSSSAANVMSMRHAPPSARSSMTSSSITRDTLPARLGGAHVPGARLGCSAVGGGCAAAAAAAAVGAAPSGWPWGPMGRGCTRGGSWRSGTPSSCSSAATVRSSSASTASCSPAPGVRHGRAAAGAACCGWACQGWKLLCVPCSSDCSPGCCCGAGWVCQCTRLTPSQPPWACCGCCRGGSTWPPSQCPCSLLWPWPCACCSRAAALTGCGGKALLACQAAPPTPACPPPGTLGPCGGCVPMVGGSCSDDTSSPAWAPNRAQQVSG